jgi:AraC-type DNA-binding domain-containing proteins
LVCYKEYHMDLYEKVQNGELLDKLKKSRTLKELTDCLDAIVNMYNANSLSDLKIGSAMVRKVVNQIANSYISKVSLEDMATQMNVSTEYLSRLFSKEVGVSFSEYLKEYRVSVAKKLMASSNYKIYEIGEKIGYKDPKYFCKVFKEVTGFSPKEYMIMQ